MTFFEFIAIAVKQNYKQKGFLWFKSASHHELVHEIYLGILAPFNNNPKLKHYNATDIDFIKHEYLSMLAKLPEDIKYNTLNMSIRNPVAYEVGVLNWVYDITEKFNSL